ncbi:MULTISPECIES: DUF6491 family protein [unclassified Luteimonas]
MKKLLITLLAAMTVTACTHTGGLSTPDRLALYRANAGEPVSGFQHTNNVRWTALGDEALAVWTRNNQAFLLELGMRCTGLSSAHSISLSNARRNMPSGMTRRVSATFDSVHVIRPGGGGFQPPCRIQSIRPLDTRGLANDKQELREAQSIEREPEPGEE